MPIPPPGHAPGIIPLTIRLSTPPAARASLRAEVVGVRQRSFLLTLVRQGGALQRSGVCQLILGHLRILQIGIRQHSAFQVGFDQLCSSQVSVVERRPLQIRAAQVGSSAHVGVPQPGVLEVGPVRVRHVEARASQVGSPEARAAQDGGNEVSLLRSALRKSAWLRSAPPRFTPRRSLLRTLARCKQSCRPVAAQRSALFYHLIGMVQEHVDTFRAPART